MQVLKTLLLVAGATAVGAAAGGYGTLFLAMRLFVSSKPDGVGGAGYGILILAIPCLFFGAVGAIAGFLAGARLAPRCASEPWDAFTWVGVGLGLMVGWPLGSYDLTAWWPVRAVLMTAAGTVVGFAAHQAEAAWRAQSSKPVQRARPRPRKKRILGGAPGAAPDWDRT